MTYDEYMEIYPDADITPGNEKEYEFVMNEFLGNNYGCCDINGLSEMFLNGPVVYEGMFDKIICHNLKELIIQNYKYYKATIDLLFL